MEERSALNDNTFFWVSSLYDFKCTAQSVEHIDLGEGAAIWRIPSALEYFPQLGLELDEVEWAIRLPDNPKGREKPEVPEVSQCVTPEMMDYAYSVYHDLDEIVIDLITALRLQKKGGVAPGPLILIESSNGNLRYGGVTRWVYLAKFGDPLLPQPAHLRYLAGLPRWFYLAQSAEYVATHKYELFESELNAFKSFWLDFRNKRKSSKLSEFGTALKRFNSSYDGPLEDRLIDQMIALESLYLGDIQELSYKLASRAAFLLGARAKNRKSIFENLREAYKTRSKIVHGLQERPTELSQTVSNIEEYLRLSIQRFLSLVERYSMRELKEALLDQNVLEKGKILR